MKYQNIVTGKFISRPNRFIANVLIDGRLEKCHVKNTGRCRELLVENANVYLEKSDNSSRRTRYSVIAVEKGGRLINIDSQAPNKVFLEAVVNGRIELPGLGRIINIKAEKTYGRSRFDFYLEGENGPAFAEVKGVTLEESGIVKFPDAPTLRGERHVYELTNALKDGYKAYLVFIVQMDDVEYFLPNDLTHPGFAKALRTAREAGVHIMAYETDVAPGSIELSGGQCRVVIP